MVETDDKEGAYWLMQDMLKALIRANQHMFHQWMRNNGYFEVLTVGRKSELGDAPREAEDTD